MVVAAICFQIFEAERPKASTTGAESHDRQTKSYEEPTWYKGLLAKGPKTGADLGQICATTLKNKGLWG